MLKNSLLTRLAVTVSDGIRWLEKLRVPGEEIPGDDMMSDDVELLLVSRIGRTSLVVTFDVFGGAEQGGQRSLVLETAIA